MAALKRQCDVHHKQRTNIPIPIANNIQNNNSSIKKKITRPQQPATTNKTNLSKMNILRSTVGLYFNRNNALARIASNGHLPATTEIAMSPKCTRPKSTRAQSRRDRFKRPFNRTIKKPSPVSTVNNNFHIHNGEMPSPLPPPTTQNKETATALDDKISTDVGRFYTPLLRGQPLLLNQQQNDIVVNQLSQSNVEQDDDKNSIVLVGGNGDSNDDESSI